jgi:GTP:adenosylcobinamide-phosphate guanylyltransferase
VTIDAVVLAGGTDEHLGTGAPYKGVIELLGRPMVDYVLEALRASGQIAHIAVVVPTAAGMGAWADRADKIVISDEGVVANLLAGVDSFGYERQVLALAADIPLLSGASIDSFLSDCGDASAECYYPLISREVAERAYPGVRRTYIHVREGVYTGGNLLLLDPRALEANRDLAERAFAARKSTPKLVRILGFRFLAKLLFRTLTMAELEAKVGEIIGGRVVTVPTTRAEIGLDVDKPGDLALVLDLLERR